MDRVRQFVIVAVVVVLAGCTDGGSPVAPTPAPGGPLHSLKWAPAEAPRRFAVAPSGTGSGPGLEAAPPAPTPLSANQVSFWAYKSQDASVMVNYLAADSTWQPYVSLSVPAGALSKGPDGTSFADGDSVEITLTFDTTAIAFEAEPSGLQFSFWTPAVLKVWYGGTNPDFNGDGVVNFLDRYIENVLLGVYTRSTPDDPWISLPSIQSLLFQRFTVNLRHFCGYAVDW